jgi:hypothetical protein
MTPVSPVMLGSEAIELVLGKGQKEYIELPSVYLDQRDRPMVTRWRLTEEERAVIAEGGDIVLTQLTWWQRFQPVHLQVVMPDDNPILLEEVS